nr:MAG TPA: hypothetical protein [Caudoviricetes sp.]
MQKAFCALFIDKHTLFQQVNDFDLFVIRCQSYQINIVNLTVTTNSVKLCHLHGFASKCAIVCLIRNVAHNFNNRSCNHILEHVRKLIHNTVILFLNKRNLSNNVCGGTINDTTSEVRDNIHSDVTTIQVKCKLDTDFVSYHVFRVKSNSIEEWNSQSTSCVNEVISIVILCRDFNFTHVIINRVVIQKSAFNLRIKRTQDNMRFITDNIRGKIQGENVQLCDRRTIVNNCIRGRIFLESNFRKLRQFLFSDLVQIAETTDSFNRKSCNIVVIQGNIRQTGDFACVNGQGGFVKTLSKVIRITVVLIVIGILKLITRSSSDNNIFGLVNHFTIGIVTGSVFKRTSNNEFGNNLFNRGKNNSQSCRYIVIGDSCGLLIFCNVCCTIVRGTTRNKPATFRSKLESVRRTLSNGSRIIGVCNNMCILIHYNIIGFRLVSCRTSNNNISSCNACDSCRTVVNIKGHISNGRSQRSNNEPCICRITQGERSVLINSFRVCIRCNNMGQVFSDSVRSNLFNSYTVDNNITCCSSCDSCTLLIGSNRNCANVRSKRLNFIVRLNSVSESKFYILFNFCRSVRTHVRKCFSNTIFHNRGSTAVGNQPATAGIIAVKTSSSFPCGFNCFIQRVRVCNQTERIRTNSDCSTVRAVSIHLNQR